jgi:hypothetical protein
MPQLEVFEAQFNILTVEIYEISSELEYMKFR